MASQRQQVRELVGPRHGGGWAASEDRQVRLGTAGPNVQAGPEWMLVSRTAFLLCSWVRAKDSRLPGCQ